MWPSFCKEVQVTRVIARERSDASIQSLAQVPNALPLTRQHFPR